MDLIDDIERPQSKPRLVFRRPVLAALLSIFFPGLGQVYNGEPKKGAILLGLIYVVILLTCPTGLILHFYGLVIIVFLELCIRIYIIYDAYRTSKRLSSYVKKTYNTWYYHVLIGLGILVLNFTFVLSGMLRVRSFSIDTGAGEPVVQVQDKVLADMWAYNSADPTYGDIVIFEHEEMYWTYRVVGMQGDKLDIIDNKVYLNDKSCEVENSEEPVAMKRGDYERRFGIHKKQFTFFERLPNGHTYEVFRDSLFEDNPYAISTVLDIKIPKDHYYLLGNNRSNALDSRFIGLIHKDRVQGRVIYSYWGATSDRINVDFRTL